MTTHAPGLPHLIESEKRLDETMSRPSSELVRFARSLGGDLLVLGVGGKVGLTLAALAARAFREAGTSARVIGVSRFSEPGQRERLEENGIETISCDLMDRSKLEKLPDAKHVVFKAGRKFGSTGGEPLTWAVNVFLPGLVAERFAESRIVAFSTGNVYPFVPVDSGGATEVTRPSPIGDYAQSCLGRERILEYFSEKNGTPIALIRLNYAIDLRYGVLLDLAQAVLEGRLIDLEDVPRERDLAGRRLPHDHAVVWHLRLPGEDPERHRAGGCLGPERGGAVRGDPRPGPAVRAPGGGDGPSRG
jgi:hypothetical protein